MYMTICVGAGFFSHPNRSHFIQINASIQPNDYQKIAKRLPRDFQRTCVVVISANKVQSQWPFSVKITVCLTLLKVLKATTVVQNDISASNPSKLKRQVAIRRRFFFNRSSKTISKRSLKNSCCCNFFVLGKK